MSTLTYISKLYKIFARAYGARTNYCYIWFQCAEKSHNFSLAPSALATFTNFLKVYVLAGLKQILSHSTVAPLDIVLVPSCPCSRKILATPLIIALSKRQNVSFVPTAPKIFDIFGGGPAGGITSLDNFLHVPSQNDLHFSIFHITSLIIAPFYLSCEPT